jgi:4-amino-4-deoxy-L-arabinose transferase-like glycosyltransferase
VTLSSPAPPRAAITSPTIPAARAATASWTLLVLVALAAVLRFATLRQQSYWYDEAVTVHLVRDSFGAMLRRIPQTESTPPVYYAVTWGWSRVFGNGEVGLRSLSAIAGTATVPLVYRSGRRLGGRPAGLVAGGLAAVSPFFIWYAQEARAYALVALLCAASLLLYLRARTRPSPGRLAAWAAVSAVALATHYFAVFVVGPELAFLIAGAQGRARRRVVAAGAALVPVAGVLLPVAVAQRDSGRTAWIAHIPLADRIGQVPLQFLSGLGERLVPDLGVVLGLAVVAGVLVLLRRLTPPLRGETARVLAIGAAGVALPLVLAAAGADELLSRNAIVALPALMVGTATVLAAPATRRFGLPLAAVAAALGLAGTAAVVIDPALQRPAWRTAARLIGDAGAVRAIVAPGGFRALPLEIYLHRADSFPKGRHAVPQVVELGAQGGPGACWWGAVCDLPTRAAPRRPPLPGFTFAGSARAGRFTVSRFDAARPARVSARQLGLTTAVRGRLLVLVDPVEREDR